MGLRYTIDRARRLVHARGWGTVSVTDINELTSYILMDARFDPYFRSLADFREVTLLTGDSIGFAAAASVQLYVPGTRRAFVAAEDQVFGLLRMFATYSERFDQVVQVFRDMDEAERWLEVGDVVDAQRGASAG
jgi:hypothetical protein